MWRTNYILLMFCIEQELLLAVSFGLVAPVKRFDCVVNDKDSSVLL